MKITVFKGYSPPFVSHYLLKYEDRNKIIFARSCLDAVINETR